MAFFGGSFDPPHLGHLAVARAAREALQLDRVLFAPVGAQPLKPKGSTASFPDRLAMTGLAIAGEPGFEISLADAPSSAGQPNYSLETLRMLRAGLPAGGCLYCLMGADSFASLRHWHGAAEIPFAASLIVASRPGRQLDDVARFLPKGLTLEPLAGAKARTDSGAFAARLKSCPDTKPASDQHSRDQDSPDQHSPEAAGEPARASTLGSVATRSRMTAGIELRSYLLRNAAGETAAFHLLPGLDIEISASDIRAQVRSASHDPAVSSLLPAPVADYIRTHALYR